MKRQFAILATALLAVLAMTLVCPPAAFAQTSEPVYVPFSFTADRQVMPSGFYQVSILSDQYVAFIDTKSGRAEKIVMVRPETSNKIDPLGGLIFYSTGSRNILKEVRMTGSSMHSVLVVQPKREPLAAKNATETTLKIAMR